MVWFSLFKYMLHFNQHSVTNRCPPIHAVIQHYIFIIFQVLEANTKLHPTTLSTADHTFLLSPSPLVCSATVGGFRFSIPGRNHWIQAIQCDDLHLCSCSLETCLFRTIFDHSNLSLQGLCLILRCNFAENLMQSGMHCWWKKCMETFIVCLSVLVQTNICVNIIRIMHKICLYCVYIMYLYIL